MKKYNLITIGEDSWFDPITALNLTDVELLEEVSLIDYVEFKDDYITKEGDIDFDKLIKNIFEVYEDFLFYYNTLQGDAGDVIYVSISVDDFGESEKEWLN